MTEKGLKAYKNARQRKNLEKRERFNGQIDKTKFVDVGFEG